MTPARFGEPEASFLLRIPRQIALCEAASPAFVTSDVMGTKLTHAIVLVVSVSRREVYPTGAGRPDFLMRTWSALLFSWYSLVA